VRSKVEARGNSWGVPTSHAEYAAGTSDEWVGVHSHTATHWSSPGTNIDFIDHVVVPYFLGVKQRLRLAADAKVVLIVDVHTAWLSDEFRNHLINKYPAADGLVSP
jgi:hypothetical protein